MYERKKYKQKQSESGSVRMTSTLIMWLGHVFIHTSLYVFIQTILRSCMYRYGNHKCFQTGPGAVEQHEQRANKLW